MAPAATRFGVTPLKSSYLLPDLREAGDIDPLWGQDSHRLAARRTSVPPSVFMAELRKWAKTHPDARDRVSAYLRIFRKLASVAKERERDAETPHDELALEYELPTPSALPPGVLDPLRGVMIGDQIGFLHGSVKTKKAPRAHIAELETWAEAHPAGRDQAERYIGWFRRSEAAILDADRKLTDETDGQDQMRMDMDVQNAVLFRRHLQRGGTIPLAKSDSPEWDARSHEPAWVRAHLPRVDYLARGQISNPHMASFKKLVADSRASETLPLAGFRILGLQHMVGNTGALVRALANAGVAPRDSMYLGKRYSQSPEVMDELRKDGFGTYQSHFEPSMERGWGNSTRNRRAELDKAVREMVRAQDADWRGVVNEPRRFVDRQHKYLVLDDGGDLIEHIHRYYPELHDRVVAVEQTRKGIRKVRELGVKFPVINMADSLVKLTYESPMIGEALATSAVRRLAALPVDPGEEILVVGFGEIGERTAKSLARRGYKVSVYDVDPAAQKRAAAAGFTIDFPPTQEPKATGLQRALATAKVVLSTTGSMAIKPADLEHAKDGAIFLNGASSASEFASYNENIPALRDGPYDAQRNLTVHLKSGKSFTLIARGQVINFDNGPGVIPPRYAQLIVGLLYSSALQAARTTGAGIHDLELPARPGFVADIEAELAQTNESLLDPKF